ncbi:hypothetical protein E3N88_44580 [Mikania micrantha]|uniref:Uncharacterized protein n=1 Tax=Mikania micrantha TaxID=192012 RepID=A0A5N6LBW8_9ASTR|nr:hypothetical protein E3N88_44580 [Mikania micrantha]
MDLARSGLLKIIATTTSSVPAFERRHPFSYDDTATITVKTNVPFTCHKCEPPSRSVDTTPKELMSFFTDMALMRRKEIAADSLYKSKVSSLKKKGGWKHCFKKLWIGVFTEV